MVRADGGQLESDGVDLVSEHSGASLRMSSRSWSPEFERKPTHWVGDLEGAVSLARRSGKRLVALFVADWSTPSVQLAQAVVHERRLDSTLGDVVVVVIDVGQSMHGAQRLADAVAHARDELGSSDEAGSDMKAWAEGLEPSSVVLWDPADGSLATLRKPLVVQDVVSWWSGLSRSSDGEPTAAVRP